MHCAARLLSEIESAPMMSDAKMRFVRLDESEIWMKSSVSPTISCASCAGGHPTKTARERGEARCPGRQAHRGRTAARGFCDAVGSGGERAVRHSGLERRRAEAHQQFAVAVVELAEVRLEHLRHQRDVRVQARLAHGASDSDDRTSGCALRRCEAHLEGCDGSAWLGRRAAGMPQEEMLTGIGAMCRLRRGGHPPPLRVPCAGVRLLAPQPLPRRGPPAAP